MSSTQVARWGKKLADRRARVAVALEAVWRPQHHPADLENGGRRLHPDGLAALLLQPGLGVEGVHLRRPPVHEEKDHRLGLGRVVSGSGGQRGGRGRGGQALLLGQEAGQGQPAEAVGAPPQHFAAADRKRGRMCPMHVSPSAQIDELGRVHQGVPQVGPDSLFHALPVCLLLGQTAVAVLG